VQIHNPDIARHSYYRHLIEMVGCTIVLSYKRLRKREMIPVLIKSANMAPMMGTMRKGLSALRKELKGKILESLTLFNLAFIYNLLIFFYICSKISSGDYQD
jgi:hypothetical protein